MPTDPAPTQKKAWRTLMRGQLSALDPDDRAARSRQIVQRIGSSLDWHVAKQVLLFAPLPVEPDIDALWQAGALAGKQAAYPRVGRETMRLYLVDGLGELESTRWNLREPTLHAGRETTLDDCDLVLVPGLAFDIAGGRLGRGGGFYDRLLAQRDPAKTRLVGVAFRFQLCAESLPLCPHDVRMDEICTD